MRRATEFRPATPGDKPALHDLIARSARGLSPEYGAAVVEGALTGAFGVDTQLIADGTYFVAEADGKLAACGGWSKRKTLYGSDHRAGRDASLLDPAIDAAKMRAFFVAPEFARQGIGSAMLEHCEQAALAAGFTRFEMMATLPGRHLYAVRGYRARESHFLEVAPGVSMELVLMTKTA
jgi:GNAT superfamily N-acetyltransferase